MTAKRGTDKKNKPDCDVHLQSTNWMMPNKFAGSLYLLRSNEKDAEGSTREGSVQHQKKYYGSL